MSNIVIFVSVCIALRRVAKLECTVYCDGVGTMRVAVKYTAIMAQPCGAIAIFSKEYELSAKNVCRMYGTGLRLAMVYR